MSGLKALLPLPRLRAKSGIHGDRAKHVGRGVVAADGTRAADLLTDQNHVSWHKLSEDVRLLSVPDLRERFVPDADATVATSGS